METRISIISSIGLIMLLNCIIPTPFGWSTGRYCELIILVMRQYRMGNTEQGDIAIQIT